MTVFDGIKYYEQYLTYQHLRIWVYPNYQDDRSYPWKEWLYWRNMKEEEYYVKFNRCDWSSMRGIKLVVGKKGIRVLIIKNVADKDDAFRQAIIDKILQELSLPQDYAWVIDSYSTISIIVDTKNDPMGQSNLGLKEVTMLWEGTISLPSLGDSSTFHNGFPKYRPVQIDASVFLNCAVNFTKEDIKPVVKESPIPSSKEDTVVPSLPTSFWKKFKDVAFGVLLVLSPFIGIYLIVKAYILIGNFFQYTSVGNIIGNVLLYGCLVILIGIVLFILLSIFLAGYDSGKNKGIGCITGAIAVLIFIFIMSAMDKCHNGEINTDHIHYEKFSK